MLLGSTLLHAQDPVFLLYEQNLMTVNPAAAGAKEGMQVNESWMVDDYLAQNVAVTAWEARGTNSNWGVGVLHMKDQITSITRQRLGVVVSHGVQLTEESALRWAVNAQFDETNFDNGFISVDPNDPAIPSSLTEESHLGAGLLYQGSRWRFGLSGWHLLNLPTWYTPAAMGNWNERQVNLHASTTQPLIQNEDHTILSVTPHVLLNATRTTTQLWGGVDLDAYNRGRIGVKWSGMRASDIKTLAMNAGVRLGHFRLDYVYGFKFNEEAFANLEAALWTHQINVTVPMQFASTQE